ncbi:hypothetical protein GJ744_008447 [Endocarpon pusillum]|uniref:Fungal STAND N-terminal Goodbye domain-containing protein n=1 Tax=Endocarpon pusillum TaxID=364733 RepID=A0A8H7E4H1_9EURO|nr:hypothetical protein GJ744_008447 [Endocarpon pusillum]
MTAAGSNPFALAIESFILDIKRDEDTRSPFYKEVLTQISNGSAVQSKRSEDSLAAFILDLERKQRRDSKTLWIAEKLQPLMSGLTQYMNVFDLTIQAAPCAAVVLYGGARLILQLGQNFYSCFDTVLTIMEDVGHLLQCY